MYLVKARSTEARGLCIVSWAPLFQLVILLAKMATLPPDIILERVRVANLLWCTHTQKYNFVCRGVSRNLKAESSQGPGMKRLHFLALFSVSAELFSPPEDQFSLLHSMVLIPRSTPYRLTQCSCSRSKFPEDKNSSFWSG